MSDKKRPQPPSLALANAWRKLDARARNYGAACKRRRENGPDQAPFDETIDGMAEGIQEAAMEFALAALVCDRKQVV